MIRFESKAAAAVYMLDAHASELLKILGKPLGERGVIAAEEIPAALLALRSAAEGAAENDMARAEAAENDEQAVDRDAVSLKRRMFPLLDLLERAQNKRAPVLWSR